MEVEWFKRTTDILSDQLFILQLVRLWAKKCDGLVTRILREDVTCNGLFLSLHELQVCRQQLVERFDECPIKFKRAGLYCLCAIEAIVTEVYVNEDQPVRKHLNGEVMTHAPNTRDLDMLVAKRLSFDFFGRTNDDLMETFRTVLASTWCLCAHRSLPTGSTFAPIPCTQCRFDHAFSPESEIVQIHCIHLASSLAPLPPNARPLVPDLPSTRNDKSKAVTGGYCFPAPDRAFEHLAIQSELAEVVISSRSSSALRHPQAATSHEAARGQLMSSLALRDCNEERDELADIQTANRKVALQRQEAICCKGLNECMLLRLVDIVGALARRFQRCHRAKMLEPIDVQSDRASCMRLRQNLRAMVLQDTERRELLDAFNDLILDPLMRHRQRVFRSYIDSRKLMNAIGIPPASILAYDQSMAEIINKTVFDLPSAGDPCDQFFKAVFVSGLFRLYLNSIGCDPKCVPALFRAGDCNDQDGFCFSVDGSGVVAILNGNYFARADNQDILALCITWIREVLSRHLAGEAADSLSHLLDSTTI